MGKNCKGPLVSTDGCTFTHIYPFKSSTTAGHPTLGRRVWSKNGNQRNDLREGPLRFLEGWEVGGLARRPRIYTQKPSRRRCGMVQGVHIWEGVWISMYLYVILYMYIMYTYTLEKHTVRFGSTQTWRVEDIWRLVHLLGGAAWYTWKVIRPSPWCIHRWCWGVREGFNCCYGDISAYCT